MKLTDLAWFAFQSLWQQKLRTLLNIVGVLIAAFILVFTFAAGEGINQTVTRIFHSEDYLRTIIVHPQYGYNEEREPKQQIEFDENIPEDKRKRLRSRILEDWRERSGSWIFTPLTPKHLEQIADLEHVKTVIPSVYSTCVTKHGDHERENYFQALDPDDKKVRRLLVAGEFPSSTRCNEILVSEYLAFLWGYQDEDELDELLGEKVLLRFRVANTDLAYMAQYAANLLGPSLDNGEEDSIDIDAISQTSISYEETNELIEKIQSIPAILEENGLDESTIELIEAMLNRAGGGSVSPEDEGEVNQEKPARDIELVMKVVGVVRAENPDEPDSRFEMNFFGGNVDVWLPLETSLDAMRQFEDIELNGFSSAKVIVTDEEHLEQTTEAIQAMHLNENSLLGFLKFFQGQLAVGKFAMAAIAGVVFFVSGIGITNTMIMSVMERRFEIGVMKAVGAMNHQIVTVFLAEGAMIGLLGSGLAIGAASISAWFLDDLAKQRLEERLGVVIEDPIFVFSPTLLISVVAFSALVTLFATTFPAWRASSVDPIVSLRSR